MPELFIHNETSVLFLYSLFCCYCFDTILAEIRSISIVPDYLVIAEFYLRAPFSFFLIFK